MSFSDDLWKTFDKDNENEEPITSEDGIVKEIIYEFKCSLAKLNRSGRRRIHFPFSINNYYHYWIPGASYDLGDDCCEGYGDYWHVHYHVEDNNPAFDYPFMLQRNTYRLKDTGFHHFKSKIQKELDNLGFNNIRLFQKSLPVVDWTYSFWSGTKLKKTKETVEINVIEAEW